MRSPVPSLVDAAADDCSGDDGDLKKRETGLLKVNLNCYDHLHFPRRSQTGWSIKSVLWVLSLFPVPI